MWSQERLQDYCNSLTKVDYIYEELLGCISWRICTGNNLEVVEVESIEPGQGRGFILFSLMVEFIEHSDWTPNHSVSSYCRTENKSAEYFYQKMGWKRIDLGQSLYEDGKGTTLNWTTWNQLVERVNSGDNK